MFAWSVGAGLIGTGEGDEALRQQNGAKSAPDADFPGGKGHFGADRAGRYPGHAAQDAGIHRHQSLPADAGPGAGRRHGDHRVDRHLPIFRGAAAGAGFVRDRADGGRPGRNVEQARGDQFLRQCRRSLPPPAPGDEGLGGAAGAGLRGGQPAARTPRRGRTSPWRRPSTASKTPPKPSRN